jgi:hypothetical protein
LKLTRGLNPIKLSTRHYSIQGAYAEFDDQYAENQSLIKSAISLVLFLIEINTLSSLLLGFNESLDLKIL